jgi:hypothetical protein
MVKLQSNFGIPRKGMLMAVLSVAKCIRANQAGTFTNQKKNPQNKHEYNPAA